MDLLSVLATVQTDPAIVGQLDRIADLQLVLSIAVVIVALAAIAVGGYALFVLVQVRRLMVQGERAVRKLAPSADPALVRAREVIDNVGETVDDIRVRVDEISDTIAQFNDSLRDAGRGAERRVMEFTAVLDVVLEQAHELLLDTAATAHGIHRTAEALRTPRAPGPRTPPSLPEDVRRAHGQE